MTDDVCWNIIEDSYSAAGGDIETQGRTLAARLATRSEADIIAFGSWTRTKMLEANRPDLLTAVEWVFAAHGPWEVSGDSWEYCRAWLAGHGRQKFYQALANPDLLAELFTTFENFVSGEEIEYAAPRAYERLKGTHDWPDEMFEPPNCETWPGTEPETERTAARLISRFPGLAKRFGLPQFV